MRTAAVALCFWGLCLTLSAAGHWVYVAARTLDRTISADEYRLPGRTLLWVGHGSLDVADERLQAKQSEPIAAGASPSTVLPISRFWLGSAVAFSAVAALLAWSGRWVVDGGVQSLIGLLAGHALWLGAVEMGLDIAGRRLGLAGSLEVVNGKVVGVHGAGVLIQLSIVFLIPMLIGLTFHESNRCVFFNWFRLRLPLTRRAGATGLVENYAARTTIQFFMTVWVCYVGVLWLADPVFASVGQPLLLAVLAIIVAATPYMIWRTSRQVSVAKMLRYSVSGAVVTWTGIEIAAAMQFFSEPWLRDSLSAGSILLGLTLALTATAYTLLRQIECGRHATAKRSIDQAPSDCHRVQANDRFSTGA